VLLPTTLLRLLHAVEPELTLICIRRKQILQRVNDIPLSVIRILLSLLFLLSPTVRSSAPQAAR
jgi:hypothetical protein